MQLLSVLFQQSSDALPMANVSKYGHTYTNMKQKEVALDSPFELLNLLANFFYLTSIYLCSKKCKYQTITIWKGTTTTTNASQPATPPALARLLYLGPSPPPPPPAKQEVVGRKFVGQIIILGRKNQSKLFSYISLLPLLHPPLHQPTHPLSLSVTVLNEK